MLVPPFTMTVPSARTVAFNWRRADAMDPVYVHVGEAAVRSIVSAVAVGV
jgi:hypothetical protein